MTFSGILVFDALDNSQAVTYVIGSCCLCDQMMKCNPHRVPSTRVKSGVREPICAQCIGEMNVLLKERNQPLIEIFADAYDAIPAEEL